MNAIPGPRALRVGLHDGEIFEAFLASYEWRRNDANPVGLVVKLGVLTDDDGDEAAVFDTFDVHQLERLAGVFKAANVSVGSIPMTERLGDLVGRPVRITTRNIVPREGKNRGIPRAIVAAWLPAR